jgi:parvulin-like peptidyl-prolyl isomerase
MENHAYRATSALIAALCIYAVFFVSCRKAPQSPAIARVGKQVLTLEELYRSIPPEYSDFITREQMINYIKQWIDTELLYAEAQRQKIDREPEIRARLAKMAKDLLSAEVINRNAASSNNVEISGQTIQAYFEAHKGAFTREHDVIKYIEIIVGDMKTAWLVRNQVTDLNFMSLAATYSKAPLCHPDSAPYIPVRALPPVIAEVAMQIRIGGTTAPIQMPDGCHIIRVLDKQKAGTASELSEVRDDILTALTAETHGKEIEALLSDLRLKMDCEFHFDRIPEKSTGSATFLPETDTGTTALITQKEQN